METKINLRITETVKHGLEQLAKKESKTLSHYLRELLNEHVEDFYEDEDTSEVVCLGTMYVNAGKPIPPYERSFDFTILLVWLFCKYLNPVETIDKQALSGLKDRVEKVISSSSFSQPLKMEFVKVLNDLNRFLVENDYENKRFYFSSPNHELAFNYFLLINEVWASRT